jgi:hypothetical protein
MAYLVIKGEPACLSVNIHLLKDGAVPQFVKTVAGCKERLFKLIDVEEYDPIRNIYAELGPHWADASTGSLYNPRTGQCLTSYQIQMIV